VATPRRLRITYNAVATGDTLANGSELILHEIHSLRKDEALEVSWSAILAAPAGVTETDFAADVVILEAAWNAPRAALLVQNLDTTSTPVAPNLISADPATPTVLSPTIQLDKPGGPHDTLTSRLYRVTFRGGLPSRLAGSSTGLLEDFTYAVAFDAACRGTLTVSGTYTAASSGTLAQAILTANIDTRVAAITTALGGIWALLTDERTVDDLDHTARFSRVYMELIVGETTAVVGYTTLRNQTLTIRRGRAGANGSADERPLQRISVSYTADVCKDTTTDLKALWEETLRPAILTRAEAFAGSSIAIMAEDPGIDPVGNKIAATMDVIAANNGSVLKLTKSVDWNVSSSALLRDVWPDFSPALNEPTPSYVFVGPNKLERTTTTITTVVGSIAQFKPQAGGGGGGGNIIGVGFGGVAGQVAGLFGGDSDGFGIFGVADGPLLVFTGPDEESSRGGRTGGGGGTGGAVAGRFVTLSRRETTTPRVMGLAGENQIEVTDQTVVLTERFVVLPPVAGGSGGAGGTTRPRGPRR